MIFCEGVDHSPRGTNITNSFDMLIAAEFPTSYSTRLIHIALRAKRTYAGTDMAIKLVVEKDGKPIFTHTNSLSKVRAPRDHIVPVNIGGLDRLVFPESGKYYFKFYIEDKIAASRVLLVKHQDELEEK